MKDGREHQPHSSLLSPYSNLGVAIFKSKNDLESIYDKLPTSFQHRLLIDTLRPICKSAETHLPDLDNLLWHYADWLTNRCLRANDWGLPLRIAASISTASISIGWDSDEFTNSKARLIARALEHDIATFHSICESKNLDPLHLMASGGINSFYFASLKLSHLYARMGLCMISGELGLLDNDEILNLVPQIIALVTQEVPHLHLILNETQGPHIGIFLAACAATHRGSLTESTFGLYVNDHHLVKGKVLREDINSELTLKYLRQRAIDPSLIEYAGTALPNTVLPILMICAKELGLDDAINPYLVGWHKVFTSIFLPKNEDLFGENTIEKGINVTRSVGIDFHTVSGYTKELEKENAEFSRHSPFLSERGLLKCAASYLLPNRFPLMTG
ncbi:MAG: hypothetical protein EOP04_12775 [Proteobacteria bacterium]|nr:MAG: hypothetical protein EOP04_12775 [Pseudomonadota bacterium]